MLFNDIIPMVESRYRVIADPQHRAYADLSMGGMQARVHRGTVPVCTFLLLCLAG